MAELLSGVCRSVFPFKDNAAVLNIGFGTHQALQLWQGGGLFDITPFGPPTRLAGDPLTVSNGSATITVAAPAHDLTTGDSVKVQGAPAVGRIVPNGVFTVTVVDADHFTYPFTSSAVVTKTLAASPLAVTNGSDTVTVTETSHGLADGTSVTITGAVAVGGVTPNGTFSISVLDADHYCFTFTANATSTATGGGSVVKATVPSIGGGANIILTPQVPLPEGAIDGTGSAGYGTGAYGKGPWGETSPQVAYYPRTWSFGAWGQNMLASPRGGGIYTWNNDTSARAVVLDNAPTQITQILVAPLSGGYMTFALGTQEEVSGVFNPMCIRHCSVRDNTQWSTADSGSTAREYILPGGGNIVAGRMVGPYIFVWTSDALFLGTYVGSLNQPWRFDPIGRNCGLIGPNAAVVVGQTAYWASPDRQFHRCGLGGAPETIACPILADYADNLAASQGDKVIASSTAEFSEIRFDYPDGRDGFENSRFLRLCVAGPDAGAWSQGTMVRTAFLDAGPADYPIGVSLEGAAYYHERGHSADGEAFSWFIETADSYLDPENGLLVRELWPDFKDQAGPVTLSVAARRHPQDDEIVVTAPPMAPGDAKADLLVSGRLFRVRFSGDSAPTACRIGTPVFDVAQTGPL